MTADRLTHLNEQGEAHMVDVSAKDVTSRLALAEGFIAMRRETLNLIESGGAKKGDVLATSRIAGIMAAKRTSDLIPLCHPLPITAVELDFKARPGAGPNDAAAIRVRATVRVDGKTGVEMEALTAVSVACLTIYDMVKAVDKSMRIVDIRLLKKTGGRSGSFEAT